MQQGQGLARQETVVDEEGLFDRQARVAALQLAGAIVLDALREDQILGASGRPHRVGLDEAQARDGPRQAGGLEEAARDRVAAKLPETGGFEVESVHGLRRAGANGARESEVAGPTGLEPATSGVTGRRSNQLNYDPAS